MNDKNENIDKKKILEDKIIDFNPSDSGSLHHGIFGLPFNPLESKIVLVPAPWEATVSYREGSSLGPKAILDASQQIDIYDPINPDGWEEGIAMLDIPASIFYRNKQIREKTIKYLKKYENREIDKKLQEEIDLGCSELNDYIEETTQKLLDDDKIVGLVGGDHSVPLGYLKTLAKRYKDFGILHIDAHLDLRKSYLGLKYSHASIFYNALEINNVSKLVSVGIRDFCHEEKDFVEKEKDRVSLFTDYDIRKDLFIGKTFKEKCHDIIKELPENVYISLDIDGLISYLSPNTGTPVPGGFTIEEIVFLLEELINSGKKIIGFDLCEVSPGKDEWDANVGARILYKLCLFTLKSQKSK
jgi:agmatinase